jgi:hypothetical protein
LGLRISSRTAAVAPILVTIAAGALLVSPAQASPRGVHRAPRARAAAGDDGLPACVKKGQWCGVRSANARYDVWTRATGNRAADQRVLTRSVALMDSLWGPETKLMGRPLPDLPRKAGTDRADDSGNVDSRIDVYVVGSHQPVRRDGRDERVNEPGEDDLAAAQVTDTSAKVHPENGLSGFLLMRRDRLESRSFKSHLAHELFHVHQYAHNARTRGECPNHKWWFSEASATWAQSYFVPGTASADVYVWFSEFQRGHLGATPPDDPRYWGLQDTRAAPHPYASFIWPYFMQQEKGPGAIAAAWRAAESATTCDELTADVNAQLPFYSHFHDFALRNLNDRDLGTQIPPITPRYQALHRDFPLGEEFTPRLSRDALLTAHKGSDPPREESLSIPALRAWYYHFDVDGDVQQIVIDPSHLSAPGAADLDAVVRVNGKWHVRNLSTESKTTICRDQDPVSEMYLVASNHDTDLKVGGRLEISSLNLPCGCPDVSKIDAFNATASYDFDATAQWSHDGETETATLMHHGSGLNATLPYNPSDVQHSAFDGPLTQGLVTVQDSYTSGGGSSLTADASGAPGPEAAMSLTFDLPSCTYRFVMQPIIHVTWGGDFPTPQDDATQDAVVSPVTPIPADLHLSGSGTYNSYVPALPPSSDQNLGYLGLGPSYLPAGLFQHVYTQGTDDQSTPLGSANFTWDLTPVT